MRADLAGCLLVVVLDLLLSLQLAGSWWATFWAFEAGCQLVLTLMAIDEELAKRRGVARG